MSWEKAPRFHDQSESRLIAGFSNLPLFGMGILLTAFGLLMIYSSSAVMGLQKYGDAFYFVKKQALFLVAGWCLYFVVAQIPIVRLVKLRMLFLVTALLILLAVFLPGIGASAGGAQRWISFGFTRFQPSEIARLLLVFYISATLTLRSDRLNSFNKGFLPLLIVTGAMMFLLILQPDFGGAMSVLVLSIALWFIGGVPMTYLSGLFILTIPAIVLVVMKAAYRAKRVLTFLDPFADSQGSGFQVIQSYLAFFNGGWTGVGIGNSQQKLFYLPEAHTDFIFSVLGEELGVVGVILIVSLFLGVLYLGARITRSQISTFGYYLGCGVTLFLVLPALLNMMVTFGLLPTKGLPLPFFSSGGSSLLACLLALGILQSLSSRRNEDIK
ncbi:MAG: putative lipid flippase FtsW [Bacteriovoracaceae bacterium]|nr:putative lipid flippase FtsW [Bacteriovoracaceae bacterium]